MNITRLFKSASLALALFGLAACSQPDSVITARVKASMALDSTVKASQIEVDTHDKVVTLTANVDTQEEKDRALDLARGTSGVVDVVDRIAVRTSAGTGEAPEPDRSMGEHIDDAVITASVKTKLLEDPQVKGLRIDVDTRQGIVYLTGNVASEKEKDRAVELARGTKHVKDVKPNLTVTKG